MLKATAKLELPKEDDVNLSPKSEDVVNKVSAANLVESANDSVEINEKIKTDISEENITEALDIVSAFMDKSKKQVVFSNDIKSGKMVITITDKNTKEVINQFPSEKIISMAERIQNLNIEAESISGLLVDSRV